MSISPTGGGKYPATRFVAREPYVATLTVATVVSEQILALSPLC